jgi:hypothetical protein
MTETKILEPHDPLPGGHSVVLMLRFAEDAPDRLMIEMIVTNPDRSEETSIPTDEFGHALEWEASLEVARARAEAEGLRRIWTIDRTAGPRERMVVEHGGDRMADDDTLVDDDLEEGNTGPDMSEPDTNAAPRRFR